MPRVKIVATGGTVANTLGGRIHIEQLLEEVPRARQIAEIEADEVIRVGSQKFTLAQWPQIAEPVAAAANDERYDGIVVTHGTFTAEETAYMLHLTVRTRKPIVVVCSQRQHGTPGNDGDRNLIDALRVATAPEAHGLGVLVVLNEEIHCARDVLKSNQRPDGFISPQGGLLGHVETDQVSFYGASLRRHTFSSEFDLAQLRDLPRVDIVTSYVGADDVAVKAVLAAGARGIVVNGFAFSGRPAVDQEAALLAAHESGVAVVLVNRGGGGRIPRSSAGGYPETPFVKGDNLTAQKARILLMLALGKTSHPAEIQRMFDEY